MYVKTRGPRDDQVIGGLLDPVIGYYFQGIYYLVRQSVLGKEGGGSIRAGVYAGCKGVGAGVRCPGPGNWAGDRASFSSGAGFAKGERSHRMLARESEREEKRKEGSVAARKTS